MSKDIETMTAEVRDLNIRMGWRTGDNTFGDYIALLHSEASEALEAFRDYRGKVTADDRAIVSRATGGRIRSVERIPEYEED